LLISGEWVLLQTATVTIQAAYGSKILAKVLLDSASHRTFMTDRLAKQLKLNPQQKEILSVSTFAARSPQDVSTYVVHFNLLNFSTASKVTSFKSTTCKISWGYNKQ